MQQHLQILAGPTAFKHIQQYGLSAGDISSVFGASGAAKWLAIYGLDHAIFDRWFNGIDHKVHLFGTSVGAWKLAAAAQKNPGEALTALANAYVAQTYAPSPTMADVVAESQKILAAFLPKTALPQIFEHPNFHYHFGAVRCKGNLASDKSLALTLGLAKAFLQSRKGRRGLQSQVERVIFTDPRHPAPITARDGYKTETVALTSTNFFSALTASGSIPFVMPGVGNISGAQSGVYRDGGLLDYHPVPGYFWDHEGLVLYPHFYPYLKAGWFDKLYANRTASPSLLDKAIIIAPTQAYVDSLPYGRLSDRKDFKRFRGQDSERMRTWHEVMAHSHGLGEEFLQLVSSGDIATRVRRVGE